MIMKKILIIVIMMNLLSGLFNLGHATINSPTEEYIDINHHKKLKEIEQWENKPKHIAITSSDAFKEGASFLRALGKAAREWGATDLKLSDLNLTEKEANKSVKILANFWGKIEKMDLSHNNISTLPMELLSVINEQVNILDLTDNPIPCCAQQTLDLSGIKTQVLLPPVPKKKQRVQMSFLISKTFVDVTEAHIRKNVPSVFSSLFEKYHKRKNLH